MRKFDLALPLGLAIGTAAVLGGALVEGVRPGFLLQPTAAFVVLGGTLGAVVVMRGVSGVKSAVKGAFALLSPDTPEEAQAAVARVAWIARAAQRDGVKVYENQAVVSEDALVARGLQLAAEFSAPAKVRAVLDRFLDEEDAEAAHDAATVEAAGGYAPTFGVLGAVLGLINVMRAIDDPSALGSGIATAFVATVYGVGIANLLLFPVAARMKQRHETRMRRREIVADSLVALAAKEMPTAIAERAGMLGNIARAGAK